MLATGNISNASTSVAVALSSTSLRVSWCTVQNKSTNAGRVVIKAPKATSPTGYEILNPGDSLVLWSPASLHLTIDLSEVFILPDNANDGVNFTYVK